MVWFIPLIVGLILNIISYLLAPKPKQQKPAAAQDLEDPTAEAGRPIMVVFGDMTVKSPNVLWFGEKRTRRYKVKA